MTAAPSKTCPQCGTTYDQDVKFCPRDGSALRGHRASGSLIGTMLGGRYEVLQRLGAGGMGEVYLAEHVKMGRPCAVKVMSRGLAQDAEAVARFNREAANASRINHTNVAAIYDFGETPDGLTFLAMEYIDGESLASLLDREGPLAPGRAASIGRQIAEALVAAHDLGIVHRDLKPENIMVSRTREGRDLVKVVDFGIAKASLGDGQTVTRTGFVVGTPEYMSPEQFAGVGVDVRSDVFAVGCILYKMLTGQLAYPGRMTEGRLRERIGEAPPRASDANPHVPRTLDNLVMKAMAFDPDERFQTASALRDALMLEQDSPSQTRRAIRIVRLSRRVWFTAGAVAGVALLIALGMSWRDSVTQPPVAASSDADTAKAMSMFPTPPAASPPPPSIEMPETTAAETSPTRQAPPTRARASDTDAQRSRAEAARAQREATAARVRAESVSLAQRSPVAAPLPAPPQGPRPAAPEQPRALPTPPTPVDPLPEIRAALLRYARALESRTIAEVRRSYPGLTAVEERRWRDVFDATDSLSATLSVARVLSMTPDSATVQVDAGYEFAFRRGVSGDRAPRATYRATLRREPSGWQLVSLR